MTKIVCFGEALIDFLAQPPASPDAPRAFLQYAGGAPANVAVACARLGADARFVGMVGADLFGDFLVESLDAAGVGTRGVVRTSAAKTALAFVALDADGERSFSFYRPPAADLLFRAEHFAADALDDAFALHLCSNSLTEEAIAATTLDAARRAREAGAHVCVDLNLRPALWPIDLDPRARLWRLLDEADIVKLTRAELDFLAPGDAPAVLARLFAARAQLVAITDGAAPVEWHTRTQRGTIDSYAVRAIDTTGAGDAFVAGMLCRLARHAAIDDPRAIDDALRHGAAAGALAVTRHGAFAAMPALAEVETLIENAMTATPPAPDFRSPDALRAHIAHTMTFYHPRCIDPQGGFFHYFRDDGSVYDASHRHLVSSTRFVFNYATAYREFGEPDYLDAVRHGLRYLRDAHRNADTGGYAWTLRDGKVEDDTNHCYGVAFVLLAYSHALQAGVDDARAWIDETWDLLEARYWDAAFGLYRDEADRDWHFSAYRGQNANMHLCEAMLAAFDATAERRWLDRALTLAQNMTRRQADKAGGLVWEHYDIDWNVDWNYHLDDPKHLFRPWGFQPGHQTEWAKLLLILDRHVDADWLVPKARQLFDVAVQRAWDASRGGLYYGFAPDGRVCDDDKYFWVQAESLAAAALLAARTGDEAYWQWYERLWAYSWTHFVDHRHGAWYRILDADNRKYSDEKSPAGKTDYHTMGACYEVMHVLRSHRS